MVFVFVVYIFFLIFSLIFCFHIPPSIDELKITSLFVFFFWKIQVPGFREFVSNTPQLLESNKEVPEWLNGLDQEDVDLLWSLGRLSSGQILEKIKELYNLAFELDIEEEKEMTRGKFLEVLERKSFDQE